MYMIDIMAHFRHDLKREMTTIRKTEVDSIIEFLKVIHDKSKIGIIISLISEVKFIKCETSKYHVFKRFLLYLISEQHFKFVRVLELSDNYTIRDIIRNTQKSSDIMKMLMLKRNRQHYSVAWYIMRIAYDYVKGKPFELFDNLFALFGTVDYVKCNDKDVINKYQRKVLLLFNNYIKKDKTTVLHILSSKELFSIKENKMKVFNTVLILSKLPYLK